MIYHKGFQSLLYYKLIHSKQHRVDGTAEKMAISPATLYGYAEGRSTFPVDLPASSTTPRRKSSS